MRATLLVVVLLGGSLAGCFGASGDTALPPPASGDTVHLTGRILGPEKEAVPEASLRIYRPDSKYYPATTDKDGAFDATVPRLDSCEFRVTKDGYKPARFAANCQADQFYLLQIHRVLPGGADVPVQRNRTVAPGSFVVHGHILDAQSHEPIPGAQLQYGRPGATRLAANADPAGAYELQLLPGDWDVSVERTCFTPFSTRLQVDGPTELTILLTRPAVGAPPAPTNVRAVPGPGHGQITIAWDAAEGSDCGAVHQYRVYHGASADALTALAVIGNSQAFADSGRAAGTTHHYQVAGINRHGAEGERSAKVSGQPDTTGLAPMLVSTRPASVSAASKSYPALDADGEEVGERDWRVVRGSGNCCENYVATAPDGRIYDFGGTYLRVSADAGASWHEVTTPIPYSNGEGAVAVAPNGDIVGVGWAPYSGDLLWSHKYSAVEGKWYYQTMPVHGPLYDRPWIGVVKGPFAKDGKVIPYVTFARSGAGANAYLQFISFDGVTYQEFRSVWAEGPSGTANRPWPTSVDADPDRDWIQAAQEARVLTVGNGFGLYGVSPGACGFWHTFTTDLEWACTNPNKIESTDRPFVDSLGRIHAFRLGSYRFSPDLGKTWTTLKVPVPAGWTIQEWDAKTNAHLGTTVIAALLQTDKPSAPDEARLYRYDTFGEAPVLKEILIVGDGDKDLGGGITSEKPRFDFMTVGILPNGKAVVSFADDSHGSPQLAIEL